MSGQSPARLLAPVALVVTALALLLVLTTGGGDDTTSAAPTPTATATSSRDRDSGSRERDSGSASSDDDSGGDTSYTVQAGDSPSSIAAEEGVSVDELLDANPDVDPNALAVGDELEIPRG